MEVEKNPNFNETLRMKITQMDAVLKFEYSRIEFPDISVVKENQQMVSEYFNLATTSASSMSNSGGLLPFLHLGVSPQLDDYEMTMSSPDENHDILSISPNESIQNSGFLSSSITSLSDDRNSADSIEKKNHLGVDTSNSVTVSITVEGTQTVVLVLIPQLQKKKVKPEKTKRQTSQTRIRKQK
ncbi:hypothetical protein SESBI_06698 [Sesbania bispinosa]|nr:hypothetical protein SESBI_06698 [Sesbania bispinosa]